MSGVFMCLLVSDSLDHASGYTCWLRDISPPSTSSRSGVIAALLCGHARASLSYLSSTSSTSAPPDSAFGTAYYAIHDGLGLVTGLYHAVRFLTGGRRPRSYKDCYLTFWRPHYAKSLTCTGTLAPFSWLPCFSSPFSIRSSALHWHLSAGSSC